MEVEAQLLLPSLTPLFYPLDYHQASLIFILLFFFEL